MAMSRNKYARAHQNMVSYKESARTIGPISNMVILIVLSCVLGLLYLSQVTKTNAFGYKIAELEQQSAALKTEHEDLEVASARLQSLDRVRASELAQNLVTVAPTSTIQN